MFKKTNSTTTKKPPSSKPELSYQERKYRHDFSEVTPVFCIHQVNVL